MELAGGGPAGVVDPPKESVGLAGVMEGAAPGVVPPVLNEELLPLPKRLVPLPVAAVAPPKIDD